jgi:hypothetical protein
MVCQLPAIAILVLACTGMDWTGQRVTLDHPELISALSIAKVKEQSHVFTARRQLQALAVQVAWARSRAFALTQP